MATEEKPRDSSDDARVKKIVKETLRNLAYESLKLSIIVLAAFLTGYNFALWLYPDRY